MKRKVQPAPKKGKFPARKIRAAVKAAKDAPAEENPRAPKCRICDHRHFGVAHVWK